jgi:hypothetical protein
MSFLLEEDIIMKFRPVFHALTLVGLLFPASSSSKRNSETYSDYHPHATFSSNSRRNSGGDGPVVTSIATHRVTHAHHSPTYSVSLPPDVIKKFSAFTTTQWDNHFGNGLSAHLWPQADRNALFGRLFYYQIPSFRAYIAGLEGYHEAIVSFNHQIKNDPSLAHKLSHIPIDPKTNVKDFIAQESLKSAVIVAKKNQELARAQQAAIVKQREEVAAAIQKQREQQVTDIIKAQKEDLAAVIDAAKAIKESQSGNDKVILERAYVIEKTIQEDFSSRTQKHTVLPVAHSLLQSLGHDANNFTQCRGNTLQQHIHDEFVTNLNRTAMLHAQHGNNPEVRQIFESVAEFTQVGIAYNNAGHVKQAMEISNLVSALVDYGLAVAQGLKDAVINVAHSVLHPIDTVKNIARTAKIAGYCLGKVLYVIADVELTLETDPIAGEEKLLVYQKNIQAMWHTIQEKYNETSGPEIVRAATSVTAEAFLTAECLGAAKNFYGKAHAKALELATKVERGVATAPELLASAEGLEVLIANEAAETVMLSTAENASSGSASRTVSSTLKTMHEPIAWHELDPSLGDITKLQKSEEFLKSIQPAARADHPLIKLVQNGQKNSLHLSNARGALYELEVALKLEEKGEKVLNFGEKIKSAAISAKKEYDVVTQTKLIECKNWNWEIIEKNEWTSKFGQKHLIAQEHGKIFEIYSKQPIPDWWKQWFTMRNISFHEG